MRRTMLILSLFLLVSVPATSATWYVNTSGTGDAPTIQAAMDSSVSGDTILVAAGTYGIVDIDMNPGVVLTSESGPHATRLIPGTPELPYEPVYYGIGCIWYPAGHDYTEISGFWFEGFTYTNLGALGLSGDHVVVQVSNCIFAANNIAMLVGASKARVDNCTFFENAYGLYLWNGAHIDLSYSILWDRIYGSPQDIWAEGVDYRSGVGWPVPDGYLKFSEDPQFCGLGEGNVYLQSDSPCAPGNHWWYAGDMRVIGALPVGCSTVNTEAKSWGEVKALYRGGSSSE